MKSLSEGRWCSDINDPAFGIAGEEITGEIDGDMMLFRAHVENTSGFILQRSFKCGLSDCLRRAKDGPYIART